MSLPLFFFGFPSPWFLLTHWPFFPTLNYTSLPASYLNTIFFSFSLFDFSSLCLASSQSPVLHLQYCFCDWLWWFQDALFIVVHDSFVPDLKCFSVVVSPRKAEQLGVTTITEFAILVLSPVLLGGVFEQFCKLQRIFADFLNRCEKKAINGNVNHLLKQSTGLKEVPVFALLHQLGEFNAGTGMIVTILWINSKAFLLLKKKSYNFSEVFVCKGEKLFL